MPAKGFLKTHCYMGHPLEGDNVRLRAIKGYKGREYNSRNCYQCHKTADNLRYHKKKKMLQQKYPNLAEHHNNVYYTKQNAGFDRPEVEHN